MFNKVRLMQSAIRSEDISNGIWNGTVVDNVDPKKVGRIKVSIPTLTEGINTEDLPWWSGKQPFNCTPNSQGKIPPIGSEVVVEFPNNDIYNGLYSWVLISIPPT